MPATHKLATRHFVWTFAINDHAYVFLCDARTCEELYRNFAAFMRCFPHDEADEIVEDIFARFDSLSNFVRAWWTSEDSAKQDLQIALARFWLETTGLTPL